MTTVVFVDTSILANIVRVPGKDQDYDDVIDELRRRIGLGEELVLPVTAVVECGNHVAQIKGAHNDRFAAARRFVDILCQVRDGEAPWVFNQAEWDAEYWTTLLAGAGTGEPMEVLLNRGIGAGDIAILAERETYRQRTGIDDVRIWSLDQGLAAYS